MEYQIPYPRRYDQSLNPAGIVNVIDASVNLSLTPLSTAALIVHESEDLPLRSWVEMYTSAGSAGIFRVRSPGREFRNGTKEYDLDHAIAEVGDYIIKADFEENDYATAVIPHLFAYYGGSKWQLGTVAAYEKINVVSRYGDVLSAICSALDQLPDYMMAFDFTTTPWTFSIVARPSTVAGEARLTRNIASLRITEDDSELCTRIYGDGLGANGYIDADTVSTYGVIERYAAKEDEEQTDADFLAQCQKYLNQYKNPLLTINIEEQDLQQATNEPLDGAKIGYMFRLVLPDYGITQTQRVHLLTWRNVYSNPGLVTVSLSNQPLTLNSYLYSSASSAASSHRSGGSSAQLKYSMIAQDKHITEQGEILHAAGLEIDPHGVWAFAKEEGALGTMQSDLRVQADAITSEVTRATNAEGQMSSRITQTADAITAEVTRATDAEGNLSSRITVNAEGIATKVEKNGVISAINQSAESVTINANKINLEGYVTATEFEAEQARLDDLKAGRATATMLRASMLQADNTFNLAGSNFGSTPLQMGSIISATVLSTANAAIELNHYHAITASESDGVVTITSGAPQLQQGTDSFNIADTQFYKDAVASAKNAMGVQIDQANQSVVVAESATKSALIASTVNLIYNTNNHKYTATTAATANGTTMHTNSAVSGTEAYDAGEGVGYTAGYSEGVNDGYLTGWNAAVAAISRNGNSIIGPATSDGSSYTTETKYTANYTPSAYTQETHRYTPSTYVAESHSYTPSDYTRETTVYNTATVLVSGSSHSHSSAWIRQDSGSRIYNDTTLNLSGDHTVRFDSGSDSYTKETTSTIGYYRISTGSSYTASTHSYTASVYDAETHSYTPSSYTGSSFSWS